ncbi:MAG: ATP-binding cassette domain-containing protein [bacterium]
MLIGQGIHKSFNGKDVLQGVNVEVQSGRISVLIGPSGSGKTTLIRALALIDYPSKGTISFNGDKYSFPLESGLKIKQPWPEITVCIGSAEVGHGWAFC